MPYSLSSNTRTPATTTTTRTLAVADVYDALVSARVYREAWSPEETLAHLRRDAGTAYDERCVDALESAVTGSAPVRATVPQLRAPAASPGPSAP